MKFFFQHKFYFPLPSLFFALLIISLLSLSLTFSPTLPIIEIVSQNSTVSPNCLNFLHNLFFLNSFHHLIMLIDLHWYYKKEPFHWHLGILSVTYCQCEWMPQLPTWHLWHYPGEEIVLLHYSLAKMEVCTLHSAFGVGSQFLLWSLPGIEQLLSKSFLSYQTSPFLLFFYQYFDFFFFWLERRLYKRLFLYHYSVVPAFLQINSQYF